jgi:biopolymer transport protein ExbD
LVKQEKTVFPFKVYLKTCLADRQNNSKPKSRSHFAVLKKPLNAGILVLLIGVLLCFAVLTLPPFTNSLSVEWQQYLPGISGTSVIQASDGGFLALGQNAVIKNGASDIFTNYTSIVVKTGAQGNVVWVKDFSVNGTETSLSKAIELGDGNYMLAGSNAVIVTYTEEYPYPPSHQLCLIKINSKGDIIWTQTYIHGEREQENALADFMQTSDGGFALVGNYAFSSPSDENMWFVKVDAQGSLQWNKTISRSSYASWLTQTSDTGYVIIGGRATHGPTPSSFKITKIDSAGNVQWYKTYGGAGDYYSAVSKSAFVDVDGGYVIAGSAGPENGPQNGWIIKTDAQGNEKWSKIYANNNFSTKIESILQTNNGGFTFLAAATKQTYYQHNYETCLNTWIVQTDNHGNIQRQTMIYIGSYYTSPPTSMIQTTDGGHVFVGTRGESYEASFDQHFWMVKIGEFSLLNLAIIIALIIIIETVIIITARKQQKKKQNQSRHSNADSQQGSVHAGT